MTQPANPFRSNIAKTITTNLQTRELSQNSKRYLNFLYENLLLGTPAVGSFTTRFDRKGGDRPQYAHVFNEIL